MLSKNHPIIYKTRRRLFVLSDFIALTESINNKLIKCQGMLKEVVLETDVIKALTYLESLNITETEHCLLFCASLNLCNTYVKQSNSKIGYAFKQKIIRLVKSVCEKDIQGICFDLQSDGKMSLLVVQIGKVQFSFHEICKEEISSLLNQHSQLQSNLEWDGIRKQICATTTFYLSEESTQNLMTVSGGPMEVELDRIKNKILSNQTTIRDIVSAPCQNKEKKQSCLTSGATLGDILKAQGIDLMTMISDK